MKKIKGINRKASKNKRYRRRIGYREFISSIEARKALVKSLNLMDDTFFAAVMEDTEVCTYVLREITGIDTLTVKACKVQYHIRNLISHSVILDILAEDDSGRVYNIGVHEIYLNTKITTDRDITKLLQYFKNSDASRDDFGPLSDKVRFYKNNEKGGVSMCEKVQRLIDESNEELRIKYAKELEIKDKALEREKDINFAQAAEISRLKAQIAEMQGS